MVYKSNGNTAIKKAWHATGTPAIQLVLVMLAISGLLLAPRDGEQVTLFPLNEASERAMPGVLSAPGIRIIGRGSLPGSYVVIGQHQSLTEMLTAHGILMLTAANSACVSEAV